MNKWKLSIRMKKSCMFIPACTAAGLINVVYNTILFYYLHLWVSQRKWTSPVQNLVDRSTRNTAATAPHNCCDHSVLWVAHKCQRNPISYIYGPKGDLRLAPRQNMTPIIISCNCVTIVFLFNCFLKFTLFIHKTSLKGDFIATVNV